MIVFSSFVTKNFRLPFIVCNVCVRGRILKNQNSDLTPFPHGRTDVCDKMMIKHFINYIIL